MYCSIFSEDFGQRSFRCCMKYVRQLHESSESREGNLNVMYCQTFADAGVMGPIFKCQPATYRCWNTSSCLSPAQTLHHHSLLLSFFFFTVFLVCHKAFYALCLHLKWGVTVCSKALKKIQLNVRLLQDTRATFLQLQPKHKCK